MDDDVARDPWNLDAFSRVFVVVAALVLERRMPRRALCNAADEVRQRSFELGARSIDGTFLRDFAFRVAGCRRGAQANGHRIGLVGLEQELRELGGLAEADRQESGR